VAQPSLTTCSGCGVASQLHGAFHNEPNSIRKFCPPCWEKRDAANSYIYFGTYLFLGLLGVVLAFYKSHWGFLLLTFFLFHSFGIVATLPHELGHALAARACGMHVFHVAVGVGRKLFQWRILGVLVDFRAIPYGGVTMALTAERKWIRIREFLYAFAGPLANLLLALLVLALVGWPRLADFRPHEKLSPWTLFFAANVLVFVTNLIPRSFPSSAGQMVSDGVHILRAFVMKPAHFDPMRIAYYLAHAATARERCDMQAAAQWTEQGLKDYPAERTLRLQRALDRVEARDFTVARETLRELLPDCDQDDLEFRALLLNEIASVDVLIGTKELLHEADDYSQDALKLLPWSPAIKGTRGAVLVQRGEVEKGIDLLQSALRETEERWLRARYACFLAMAEACRGNNEVACNYLAFARQIHSDCILLPQAEQTVRATQPVTRQ
jgi:tetratricopeptide (TPR) repeat protein